MKARILLTGVTGQLGRELYPFLQEAGEVIAVSRTDCDLTSVDSVKRLVGQIRPSVIVNPAAYTAVDKAETDRETAYQVNCIAAGTLAKEARKLDAMFVHYSTDYVFDGSKKEAYVEDDEAAPLNVYGASKLEGERSVISAGGRFLVLRTSWVYGASGPNFFLTIRRLARERQELRIVDDQVGSPTTTKQIARATAELVKRYSGTLESGFPAGLYHMTASGSVSWYGFAKAILAALKEFETFRVERLSPIQSKEYPTPARRPLNSVLNNRKFERTFGFWLGSWESGLDEVAKESKLRELSNCSI